jgi:hypothetical protein
MRMTTQLLGLQADFVDRILEQTLGLSASRAGRGSRKVRTPVGGQMEINAIKFREASHSTFGHMLRWMREWAERGHRNLLLMLVSSLHKFIHCSHAGCTALGDINTTVLAMRVI